jgi:hypothetical protein
VGHQPVIVWLGHAPARTLASGHFGFRSVGQGSWVRFGRCLLHPTMVWLFQPASWLPGREL